MNLNTLIVLDNFNWHWIDSCYYASFSVGHRPSGLPQGLLNRSWGRKCGGKVFNDSIFQGGIEKNDFAQGLTCLLDISKFHIRTKRESLPQEKVELGQGQKENQMDTEVIIENGKTDELVREIIELERRCFVEKRNVKTERRRKLQAIIERHTKPGSMEDDT